MLVRSHVIWVIPLELVRGYLRRQKKLFNHKLIESILTQSNSFYENLNLFIQHSEQIVQ